jgi:DNA-binding NarL/FixJ family response regulator
MGRSVLVVDDHAGFRAAARALLEAEGYHVVGEAADAAEALASAGELQPEVILLDVQLPDLDGFEVAERLAPSDAAVVLVSSRGISSFRRRLATSPARGFIAKADLSGETLAAVLASG